MTRSQCSGSSEKPGVRFGLAGDMHFGSAYCNTSAIKEYYREAKKFGASRIFQVGDLLEGSYRHHAPGDLHGHGFDEQAAIAERFLPRNIPTSFICGNHDYKFSEQGQNAGRALVDRLKRGGDLKYLGERRAFVKHRGLKICLFHPGFGQGKASTLGFNPVRLAPMSALEKFLVSVKDRENPDIVAVGHWHQSSYFYYRGMCVFLCGTFQNPGGPFSNSLSSAPAVGSWLVDVKKRKGRPRVTPTWIGFDEGSGYHAGRSSGW